MMGILENLGIQEVELGFKFPSRGEFGPFSNVNDTLLQNYIGFDRRFGFMVESKAAEAFDSTLAFSAWALSDTSLFSFVRIATTLDDFDTAANLASELIGAGKRVFINLMRASELDVALLASVLGKLPEEVAGLYLADSFGSLNPESTARLVSFLTGRLGIDIGFHAHNNRGMAFANSLAAIQAGASLVDGTLAGHGRGSGNARTEELSAELSGYADNLFQTAFELGSHLEKFEYGPSDAHSEASFAFHLGAKLGYHPNVIMAIFDENPSIGLGEVLSIISRKADVQGQPESSAKALLRELPEASPIESDQLNSIDGVRGSTFFLFARGESLEQDYEDFSHFQFSAGIRSGMLNSLPGGQQKVDLVFALHSFRQEVVARTKDSLNTIPIRVCAFPAPDKDLSPTTWKFVKASYSGQKHSRKPSEPIQLEFDTVLAYALNVLGLMGVKEICLAGFDQRVSHFALEENGAVLEWFSKDFPEVKVTAIRENAYNLPLNALW